MRKIILPEPVPEYTQGRPENQMVFTWRDVKGAYSWTCINSLFDNQFGNFDLEDGAL